jgi:hypothetical protein
MQLPNQVTPKASAQPGSPSVSGPARLAAKLDPRLSTAKGADWGPTGIVVLTGLGFVIVCFCVIIVFPPKYASCLLGLLVSCAACFVMICVMPRAAQLGLVGAAVGVSADGAYANLTDQTPVTIATALVNLANGLAKAVGLIASDAKLEIMEFIPLGVWSFILCTVAIMGASFLIKHND